MAFTTPTGLSAAKKAFLKRNSPLFGGTNAIEEDLATKTDVTTLISELEGAGQSQEDLIFEAATELTIASGAITAAQGYHSVDTEADAASDDLDTINGLTNGEILLIRPNNATRTVVIKHATGNIYCPAARDISLAESTDWALLVSDGTNVVVLAFNTLAAGGGGFGSALASTVNGEGASLVGVEDAGSNFVGANLELILSELADSKVKIYLQQVTHADLTDAALSQNVSLPAFPISCIPLGATVDVQTEFSGGGAGSCTAEIGDAGDTDELAGAVDVFTGAGTGAKDTKPTAHMGFESAYAPVCRITADVNVDTLTAGDLIALIWYRTIAS